MNGTDYLLIVWILAVGILLHIYNNCNIIQTVNAVNKHIYIDCMPISALPQFFFKYWNIVLLPDLVHTCVNTSDDVIWTINICISKYYNACSVSNASETVCRKIFCNKYFYGVRNVAYNWINSYFYKTHTFVLMDTITNW